MGFQLQNEAFNRILDQLKREYKIYAPKHLQNSGRFSDTDLILYQEIDRLEEIATEDKAHFSPKEIIFPITQTLLYFSEDEYQESTVDNRKIIIFLRPCDINGIRRLDTIFLNNGHYQDLYYERLRTKVKFFMLECHESFKTCFCVSMKANFTDNYSVALRFGKGELYCDVKDEAFEDLFKSMGTATAFTPQYVQENYVQVEVPDEEQIPVSILDHSLWQGYSKRCIGCGRCNMACITCSCFTVRDIAYEENPGLGERRRTWAGCHIDNFTDMAGGHSFRQDYGSRMRFKTMHKIYDYKTRFGEYMCIGCGRCDDCCPEYISFSNCINTVSAIVKGEESDAS